MNGTKEYDKKHQETFRYTFDTLNIPERYIIEVPIDIPFEGCVNELSHRIINGFDLPLYVIEGNIYYVMSIQRYLLHFISRTLQ